MVLWDTLIDMFHFIFKKWKCKYCDKNFWLFIRWYRHVLKCHEKDMKLEREGTKMKDIVR